MPTSRTETNLDAEDGRGVEGAMVDLKASTSSQQPAILLLDDDEFMLEVQSQTLSRLGYSNLVIANTASVALAILDSGIQIDLVVCDLNMPKIDGIEFLQTLNARTFCGAVILLSGEGVRIMHTVQKLLSGSILVLGAIEKPASPEAFAALLQGWKPFDVRPALKLVDCLSAQEVHTANRLKQWVLHYQPKIDLESGMLAGMEALVRCNHPERGLVYPDQFIAVAENCNAIDALTDWVLQESMEQLVRWQATGLRTRMAVNVSMENLRAPGFAPKVGDMARRAGVSPRDVTLEITESRLMDSTATPLETMARLRMQRFGLSIDDFGTGHSSLVQLRDVPFTELKVDRGFVSGARHNQIIRPILEGSIGIAKRLGLLSVAEGVETEDDWLLLHEIGCDIAQGWFVSKALDVTQVPAWLTAWAARRTQLLSVRAAVPAS